MGRINMVDTINFYKLINYKSRGIETTLNYNEKLTFIIGIIFFIVGLIQFLS